MTHTEQDTNIPDSGFASVPAVQQYLSMAATCDIDVLPMLHKAGIDPHILTNNNKRIPGAALERLLALIIPDSNDPCFGLHTSQFIQPSSYGVLGYIAMNSANLKETLIQAPLYEKIVGDMGTTTFSMKGDQASVHWKCNFTHPLVRRHVTENIIASWTQYARWVGQTEENPTQIHFQHNAPSNKTLLAEYDAIFHCEICFDQPHNAIIFSEKLLEYPVQQANEQLLNILLNHATQILQEIDKDQAFVYKVKNLLRLMLKDSIPRKEVIAEKLGLTSRTLQRRLNDEGTGYQEVFNELRLELALYYLNNSDLSLDDIAIKIGFSEPRSFYRSFKQWTGNTAGSYRENHLTEDPLIKR